MGAYDTIEVKLGFGGWSVALFGGLALFIGSLRILVRFYRSFTFWIDTLFVVLPLLALAGLVCGVLGLRRGERRGLAVVGTVLNATALLSVVVALILSRVL